MAKPFVCRLALGQISINPAYADELTACIQEPSFPKEDDKTGLFSIAGLEEINRLRQNVAEQYIAHLNRKIEAIVRFAASEAVELLVFPEYSIPPESLPLCYALAEELGIAIIAGSHVVTLSRAAQQIYRDLELIFDDSNKPAEERVRQAVCVVFAPNDKPRAFTKYIRSKWESCLIEGTRGFHAFQMNTRAGRIEVQVLICIEALSGDSPKEKHTLPRLVAITAFSPTVEPFYDEGRRALLQGKCTLFANAADFGGSRVFARADNFSVWFTQKDGSKAIPKGSEGLLIVEADLEKQFEIRKSARENTAVSDMRIYPVLYPADSAEALRYAELMDSLAVAKPTVSEISNQVTAFSNLNSKVFPKLLEEKLAHFTSHIAPVGTISPEDALRWISPVAISHIPSTDGLRWELCNRSMEAVNSLIVSGKHVDKTRELAEVYVNLVSRRDELAILIQPRGKTPIGTEQLKLIPRPAEESPFIDRDAAFDKIRQFFNQQQTSAFVLGGMRGIRDRPHRW